MLVYYVTNLYLNNSKIAPAMLTCSQDSDCDTDNCYYCLSTGVCGHYESEYCDTTPCGHGDGDCDPGTCPSGTTCGSNNFLDFHPLLASCDGTSGAEVCTTTGAKTSLSP